MELTDLEPPVSYIFFFSVTDYYPAYMCDCQGTRHSLAAHYAYIFTLLTSQRVNFIKGKYPAAAVCVSPKAPPKG